VYISFLIQSKVNSLVVVAMSTQNTCMAIALYREFNLVALWGPWESPSFKFVLVG